MSSGFTCQGPQDLGSTHATLCCSRGDMVLCAIVPHGTQLHGMHEMATPSMEALPLLLVQSGPVAVQTRTLWPQGRLQGWAVAIHADWAECNH